MMEGCVVKLLSFEQALKHSEKARRRHLLLGNGFSIALKPDIFSYGSLFDNADFSAAPHVPELFRALETNDFEIVIRHLQDTARVVEVYRPRLIKLIARLGRDAAAIKDALVAAIARRHPDRPYDIAPEQYAACRRFLFNFDHLFTLNYDVLLYWALMQSEVDDLDLRPDDGFRHPEDDPSQPWVSWQQGNSATVNYLHGALHLFDTGTDIIKYTWSKTDIPIVDQIREALDHDTFPIFVAEGSTATKKNRIWHNAYLHKALRSFESCCNSSNNVLFVYGHSLAENDDHVFHGIACGSASAIYISLFGDPSSAANRTIQSRAEKLANWRTELRGERFPLSLQYYDADSARVWT
jgi:hypothetical protein